MRSMKDKKYSKKITIYASECLSSVGHTDYLNIDIIIEVIKYHYVSSGVKITTEKLNELLVNDDIDFDKYVDILNNGIRQFSDEMLITEQTTKTIIDNVIDRHEKAKHGDLGGILLDSIICKMILF
jgi:hypothetical protein